MTPGTPSKAVSMHQKQPPANVAVACPLAGAGALGMGAKGGPSPAEGAPPRTAVSDRAAATSAAGRAGRMLHLAEEVGFQALDLVLVGLGIQVPARRRHGREQGIAVLRREAEADHLVAVAMDGERLLGDDGLIEDAPVVAVVAAERENGVAGDLLRECDAVVGTHPLEDGADRSRLLHADIELYQVHVLRVHLD